MKNKSLRKLVSVFLLCALPICVISCGDVPVDQSLVDDLATSSRESQEIKQILVNNGVEITDSYVIGSDVDLEGKAFVSTDPDRSQFSDIMCVKGYDVLLQKHLPATNELGHDYLVRYSSYNFMKDSDHSKRSEDNYSYYISFLFPNEEEFLIENFPMLVDLVKIHYGADYDFDSLETFIKTKIYNEENGLVSDGKFTRGVGDYTERLDGGAIGSGDNDYLFKSFQKDKRRIDFRIGKIVEYNTGIPVIKPDI